jgi:hypothetical protein
MLCWVLSAGDMNTARVHLVATMEDFSSRSFVTRSDMETVSTNDVTREVAALEPEDKENLAVLRSKRLVILAMLAAAAVVATLVYLMAANNEHGNFTKDVSAMENRVPFYHACERVVSDKLSGASVWQRNY